MLERKDIKKKKRPRKVVFPNGSSHIVEDEVEIDGSGSSISSVIDAIGDFVEEMIDFDFDD